MSKSCLVLTLGLCLALVLAALGCSDEPETTTTASAITTTTTLAPATTTTEEITTTTTTTEAPGAWTTLTPQNEADDLPAARLGSSLVYVPAADQLLLFAGWNGGSFFNAVWRYDLEAGTWADLKTDGDLPEARALQAVAYIPTTNRLIVFGGYDGTAYFGDTWAYDIADDAWTNLGPSGTVPKARDGHALVYDLTTDKVLLFGGWNGASDFNDTWAYDPVANTWTELKPTGSLPAARDSHSMVYDAAGKRVILFGGWSQTSDFGDTWAYDPSANAWTALDPAGGQPPSRALHQMAYEAGTGKVLLFGGGTIGNTVTNDVWAYDPVANTWAPVEPTGTVPAARTGHAMTYDATGNRLFVFGGSDGGAYFNDLWTFAR